MKKEIHPKNYRPVVFKDMSNEHIFIVKSTVNTKENIEIDGKEYPLCKIEISSTSHPFYTGKMKLVDSAGRVDKFRNRYKKHTEKTDNKAKSELNKETEKILQPENAGQQTNMEQFESPEHQVNMEQPENIEQQTNQEQPESPEQQTNQEQAENIEQSENPEQSDNKENA